MEWDSRKEEGVTPEPGGKAPDKADAIRDLLFGEQMADYEKRFAELEQRIDGRFQHLEQEIRDQLDQLREELNARADRVEQSHVKRDRLASQLERLAAILRDRSV